MNGALEQRECNTETGDQGSGAQGHHDQCSFLLPVQIFHTDSIPMWRLCSGSSQNELAKLSIIHDLFPDACLHLDRYLAVLAELRLLSGQPRLGELKGGHDSTRRSIP